MEWNWEIEIPKGLAVSSQENVDDFSFSADGVMERGFSDIKEDGSMVSRETLIRLKLGQETYGCQDKARTSSFPLVPSTLCSPIVRRSRAVYQSTHSPCCQVEGCNLDLVAAKDYHRRHRICADHSKSPKVVVAGLERRFCQQCSRLHDLSEFDDGKRSCRRRLSAHNARRRRPHLADKLISTDGRRHMEFLVKGVSIPSPNSTHQSLSNFKSEDVDMIPNGALSDISSPFHGVAPKNMNRATSSWGFNGQEEPSSVDQFIHGHNIGLMQHGMPLEMQHTRNTQIPPHDFDCFSTN